MPVLIGTSGWQYRHWKETFYPKEVRQAQWLEYYAERFQVVEVNNAFYRLPEAATFARWAERTPPDFVVGVKASRYLTHVKRLAQCWTPDDDVYVFFNNDTRACALRDAHVFALACERAGLHPTRVPGARDVRLG